MPRRTRSTKRRPPRAVIILRNPDGTPTGQQIAATGPSRKKAIARVKAIAHKMGVMILNPKGRNPGLVDTIRAGDRVTIVTPHGSQLTGRAVMPSPDGNWVLNMGGRHGTPGIATDRNTVRVKHSGKGPKYYPGLGPSRNPRRRRSAGGARPRCNPKRKRKAGGMQAPKVSPQMAAYFKRQGYTPEEQWKALAQSDIYKWTPPKKRNKAAPRRRAGGSRRRNSFVTGHEKTPLARAEAKALDKAAKEKRIYFVMQTGQRFSSKAAADLKRQSANSRLVSVAHPSGRTERL